MKSVSICVSWIGNSDLKSITESKPTGPVYDFINSNIFITFDYYYIFFDQDESKISEYSHITKINETDIIIFKYIPLKDPTNYRDIYNVLYNNLIKIKNDSIDEIKWHFFTSPGTPQMAAILILLGKTDFPATFYQTFINKETKESKVEIVDIPFDIQGFIPRYIKDKEESIEKNWLYIPEFKDVIGNSNEMKELLKRVHKISLYNVPVLLLGETGTGKTMIAEKIHKLSKREGNFVHVNCAAIPQTLFESELFGYKKGAFTGANIDKIGKIEEAKNGTLFLDEIGILNLDLQAKLLTVLQDKKITKIGENDTKEIDFRLVCATNCDLMNMIKEYKFREDLYYRISIGIIKLIPLRNRGNDALIVAQNLLDKTNNEFSNNSLATDYIKKLFSDEAKDFILKYPWQGNVRELDSAIKRLCLWCENQNISAKDFEAVLGEDLNVTKNILPILEKDIKINLEEYLCILRNNYIKEAIELTGSKEKASKMLGYNNYQTMNNHYKKKYQS